MSSLLTGVRMRETSLAVQFAIHQIDGEKLTVPRVEWFPFSQVTKSLTSPEATEQDTLTVSDWIMKAKGLNDLEYEQEETDGEADLRETFQDDDDDYFPF